MKTDLKREEIELITIEKGLEKIAKGEWYLDRYRSAVMTESGGLPHGLIFITNVEEEASRRYDSDSKSWVLTKENSDKSSMIPA